MNELFNPIYIDGRKLWEKFDEAGLFVDYYDRDIAQGAVEDMMEEDGFEIVRCKDCKHGKSLDRTKPPFKYYKDSCVLCECEDVIGDEPMVYLPDHFCSYGERKLGCSGCVYEDADGSTKDIGNCVCCSRMNEIAKHDYYKKK